MRVTASSSGMMSASIAISQGRPELIPIWKVLATADENGDSWMTLSWVGSEAG